MVKASGPPSVGGSGDALSTVMPMEPPPACWNGAVWSAQLSAEYVLVINAPSAVNSGRPASTRSCAAPEPAHLPSVTSGPPAMAGSAIQPGALSSAILTSVVTLKSCVEVILHQGATGGLRTAVLHDDPLLPADED